MNPVVSIILFLVIATLVAFIFFLRIKALQESKKIIKYFENLKNKFEMQMSFHPKEGNHTLPILKGLVKGRDTLIERTVKDKYKYLVVSISLKNKKSLTLQITPKSHLRGKEKPDEGQQLESTIPYIDKNYLVRTSDINFLQGFLLDHFLKWKKKYARVWHLFSTLVIYGDRITLVLLSVPAAIKFDLLLEEFLQDLQNIAAETEASHKAPFSSP